MKQQIGVLDSIAAAEKAEDAKKNSWSTWLMSPIYKAKEESEEDKASKDIKRQERRLEKDMKERRLAVKEESLKGEEDRFKTAKYEVDAADTADDRKIQAILNQKYAREFKERKEKENAERERLAKLREQQETVRRQREHEERERLAKLWEQMEKEHLQRQRADMERREKL